MTKHHSLAHPCVACRIRIEVQLLAVFSGCDDGRQGSARGAVAVGVELGERPIAASVFSPTARGNR